MVCMEGKRDEFQASFDPVYLVNSSGHQFSRGITLAPHKQAMLQRCLQIERLPQINDACGSSGCLALDTPVLMYDGSIKMVQDVCVGDELMGDDSMPRRVLSLARGRDKMFEVNPSWGDKYNVNQRHVLCLLSHSLPKELKKYAAADGILEIPVNALDEATCLHLQCFRTGVEFESRPINFDPYIIGLWLGSPEGLVSRESAVLHHLNKTLPGYDMHLDFQKTGRYYLAAAHDMESTLHAVLGDYNMLQDRHIAPQYRCNERCIRLQVLAGLLDSKAQLVEGGYEIVEGHARLRNDIVFLARSLGLCCRVESNKIKICGEGLPYIPVKVPKKRAAFVKIHLNDWRAISVRAIGDDDDYYGFTLDGNNRCMLGDFSVTIV